MASEIELKAKIEILEWAIEKILFNELVIIDDKKDELESQLQDLYKQREGNNERR